MVDHHPQHQRTASELWHGSDREQAVAQLEAALELQPNDAGQWCRLGESYDALASEAADQDAASTYRDKAVAALMQAIGLAPGMARAHYALANVYRAQDLCLALVEFEAAAKCDPQAYADALAQAQKIVRDCTYRLADLNLIVLESAQEQPRAALLESELYFDDRAIRSAVVHTCASEGQLQSAKLWLFEAANPDLRAERPVAYMTVSSTGNVFLSKGCPGDYQPVEAQTGPSAELHAPVLAPSSEMLLRAPAEVSVLRPVPPLRRPRRSRAAVWIPLSLIIYAGSLYAYLTLVANAPPDLPKAYAAAANESAKALALEGATDPAIVALAPELLLPPQVHAPPPATQPSAASSTADFPKKRPAHARTTGERKLVSNARRNGTVARAAAPAGVGGTRGVAVETQPSARNEQPVIAAPMQHSAAAAASVQKEQSTSVSPVPKEHVAVAAPVRKELPAPTTSWLRRMRAELDGCGRPGFWRNDLCREAIRWNYCHPNRWDTVRECGVERFASAGVSH